MFEVLCLKMDDEGSFFFLGAVLFWFLGVLITYDTPGVADWLVG